MKFLGGATTLDSFLKAYKASETKGFSPYERFDSPDKLEISTITKNWLMEDLINKVR